jgi:DNA primase catalytic core
VSRIDWSAVRGRHRLASVARRSGIHLPTETGDITICCPMPGHDDTTPSMVLHLDSDRYHCFGCGAHGDVIQWIQDLQGLNAVDAARTLDADQRLAMPASVTGTRDAARVHRDGYAVSSGRPRPERPDLDRTQPERVHATLEAAWTYYSYPVLHRRGVDYLAGRDIDITALEAEVGQAVIGHTPARIDGLINHLASRGFSVDELVDASLACRYPDGRCFDFFRHRAVMPIRDDIGRLAGLIGRTTTDAGGPKYLNMSRTHSYNKATALYRPSKQVLDRHANVIVCEGTLDALAIAAQAATSGLSDRYAPVAPSGVALSDHQLHDILAIHPLPPVFSGDGDAAGRRATVEWATRAALAGRESVVATWPDGHDPASWLALCGESGLLALTRKGCLDPASTGLRPRHAGEIIAQAALAHAASGLVSLEDALTAAIAPHAHLHGAAAARYVSAVAQSFAPIVSTAKLEAIHQRCADRGLVRQSSLRRTARDVVTP